MLCSCVRPHHRLTAVQFSYPVSQPSPRDAPYNVSTDSRLPTSLMLLCPNRQQAPYKPHAIVFQQTSGSLQASCYSVSTDSRLPTGLMLLCPNRTQAPYKSHAIVSKQTSARASHCTCLQLAYLTLRVLPTAGNAPTALLLHSYCNPTTRRLHSYCTPTALLLHADCTPTALLLHSYCTPTLLLLRSLRGSRGWQLPSTRSRRAEAACE